MIEALELADVPLEDCTSISGLIRSGFGWCAACETIPLVSSKRSVFYPVEKFSCYLDEFIGNLYLILSSHFVAENYSQWYLHLDNYPPLTVRGIARNVRTFRKYYDPVSKLLFGAPLSASALKFFDHDAPKVVYQGRNGSTVELHFSIESQVVIALKGRVFMEDFLEFAYRLIRDPLTKSYSGHMQTLLLPEERTGSFRHLKTDDLLPLSYEQRQYYFRWKIAMTQSL